MSKQPKISPERKEAEKAANLAIGQRIRLLRTHLKLNQTELGNASGFGQSRVSAWENGEDFLYAFQLAKVAKGLGVTADIILDVENANPPTDAEFKYLEEARRIGFDPAWRTLIKYGEPAKRLGSLGDASSEDES